MNNKPEKIDEEILFSNKYRKIIWKNFKLRDWKIHNYLISSHVWIKIATMVLPLTKNNEIILCKEFRYWI